MLLQCSSLAGLRLRLLSNVHLEPSQLRDCDVVAALARGLGPRLQAPSGAAG